MLPIISNPCVLKKSLHWHLDPKVEWMPALPSWLVAREALVVCPDWQLLSSMGWAHQCCTPGGHHLHACTEIQQSSKPWTNAISPFTSRTSFKEKIVEHGLSLCESQSWSIKNFCFTGAMNAIVKGAKTILYYDPVGGPPQGQPLPLLTLWRPLHRVIPDPGVLGSESIVQQPLHRPWSKSGMGGCLAKLGGGSRSSGGVLGTAVTVNHGLGAPMYHPRKPSPPCVHWSSGSKNFGTCKPTKPIQKSSQPWTWGEWHFPDQSKTAVSPSTKANVVQECVRILIFQVLPIHVLKKNLYIGTLIQKWSGWLPCPLGWWFEKLWWGHWGLGGLLRRVWWSRASVVLSRNHAFIYDIAREVNTWMVALCTDTRNFE